MTLRWIVYCVAFHFWNYGTSSCLGKISKTTIHIAEPVEIVLFVKRVPAFSRSNVINRIKVEEVGHIIIQLDTRCALQLQRHPHGVQQLKLLSHKVESQWTTHHLQIGPLRTILSSILDGMNYGSLITSSSFGQRVMAAEIHCTNCIKSTQQK